MQTDNTFPSTVYTVITYQVFGAIETVDTFSSKEDAEANVVEWANENSYDGAAFTSADEATDWFVDSDENVNVLIRLFETTVIGSEATSECRIKTLSDAKALIGEVVEVLDNDETSAFSGLVIGASKNDIDGILVSVNDQDDNTWDIEARYIVSSETVSNSSTAVFIESLQGDTATIEVVECTCGYHMGIDSSFLDQVSDFKASCPSCGAIINTALIPEISHDDSAEQVPETKFDSIYNMFLHARAIEVDNYMSNDFALTSMEEIDEELEDDECPIVLSIYGIDNDHSKFEFYFDYNDIITAEVDGNCLIMKNEAGNKVSVSVMEPKAITVKSSINKETYLVTVDHVDGASSQLCDTIGNAKAYVFGHIVSFDTFEEFDAALKGSIDAVDGVINYSIEKCGGSKMRIEPAVEMRPRYAIVMDADDKGSETLEDYTNEETAIEAFEAIRKNGYHIPESECGNLDEKITFENYGRVKFTMDVELWDNYNNHHGFGTISHTQIIMINGEVQNG